MPISRLIALAFPVGLIGHASSPTSSSALGGYPPSANLPSAGTGQPPASALSPGLGDTYKFYSGDGSIAEGWPGVDDWVDFYTMWQSNEALMNSSCSAFAVQSNSLAENEDILDAIGKESAASGVDKRFVLAIIMQESKGCVRVATTYSPGDDVRNPGLMQTHNGSGTCSGTQDGPCDATVITQMVKDGVTGTSDGDGLAQCLDKAHGSTAAQYYRAARAYNSGSVDASGDLGSGCCTHCYASDVANRLTGWVKGPSKCTLDGWAG
ncbi:hypothetical protein LTR85_006303 [Meristemomyces frigidus]|nr:hypothetical protein LTR85_006303 [Meristemomyces frigidus]